MYLTDVDPIIWDVRTEEPLDEGHIYYKVLNSFVDINEWKLKYGQLYKAWLEIDDTSIHDIHHSINKDMINALIDANKHLDESLIYFWFDIDRSEDESFEWEVCPLSRQRLQMLGSECLRKNKLISPDFPIIFPVDRMEPKG